MNNPMLNEVKPVLVIVLNLLVGIAVSKGYVEQGHQTTIVNTLSDVFGMAIVLATSIYSLHRYVHRHPQQQSLTTQTTVTATATEPVAPVVQQLPMTPVIADPAGLHAVGQ